MTRVTVIKTKGALGFHQFFALPDGTFFEFSRIDGYKEGLLAIRGTEDVVSKKIVESSFSQYEIKERARQIGAKPYRLFRSNCRVFVRHVLSNRSEPDYEAFAAIALMTIFAAFAIRT